MLEKNCTLGSDICTSFSWRVLARGSFSFSLGLPRIMDFTSTGTIISLFLLSRKTREGKMLEVDSCLLSGIRSVQRFFISITLKLQPTTGKHFCLWWSFRKLMVLDKDILRHLALGRGENNEVWWVIENQWIHLQLVCFEGSLLTLAITQRVGILFCRLILSN